MSNNNRIATNIIYLNELYVTPCEPWLSRFDKDGKMDADEAFRLYGEYYDWLYENSPYDLISWQIDNDKFDWELYSKYVVKYCIDKFDSNKYNWKDYSWAV